MQVNNPLFFCLDGHNNILISDYSSQNIEVFSQAGDLLHTITINIWRNFCITAYKNIIILTSNNSIEIFTALLGK